MPTLSDSVRLVADDTRQSYPDLSDAKALAHVHDTMNKSDLYDTDTPLGEAYTVVLDFLTEITHEGPRLSTDEAVRELLVHAS